MTIDQLTGVAFIVLQLLAMFWGCVLLLRIVFGVKLNENGNPEAYKPRGIALLMGAKTVLRASKAVTDGVTSTINKMVAPSTTRLKRPVVIDVWGNEPQKKEAS